MKTQAIGKQQLCIKSLHTPMFRFMNLNGISLQMSAVSHPGADLMTSRRMIQPDLVVRVFMRETFNTF